MTSDAKIGLLLGLVFIFVIAFVINGLPSFRNATNGSELTMNMVSSQREDQPIGTNERIVQSDLDLAAQTIEEPLKQVIPSPAEEKKEDVRFEMPIPEDFPVVKETSVEITPDLIGQTLTQSDEPGVVAPQTVEPTVPAYAREHTEVIELEVVPVPEPPKPEKPQIVEKAAPKVYVVADGDTLASIAKKFYGPLDGNKMANNLRIFEANRSVLKSPHELKIGQKLVVPPLNSAKTDSKKPAGTFVDALFEQAKSIGGSLLPSAGTSDSDRQTGQGRQYVVQDDDNLWQIATKQLGSPLRYKEIIKLNPAVLKNEKSTLQIGMKLSLPVQ